LKYPSQEVVLSAIKSDFSNQHDQLFCLILENAHDLIAIHSLPDLGYEYANPSTLKILGYPKEELLTRSAKELIHPDDIEMVLNKLIKYLDEEKNIGYTEFRCCKKDGSYIWLDATGIFLKSNADKQSIIIFSRDITERKRTELELYKSHAELAYGVNEKTSEFNKLINEMQNEIMNHMRTTISLEKSKRYYKTLFENSGTAILILDKNLNLIMVNPMFEKLSGYSQKELLNNKTWTHMLTPESLKLVYENYMKEKAAPEKGECRIEIQGISKNGQIQTFIGQVSVVPESSNFIVSLLDITEQRQFELLSKLNENRFYTLFEKAPIGIAINRKAQILFVNQAYVEMFGYTDISELLGNSILFQVAKDCRNEIANKIKMREQGHQLPFSHESIGVRKDGSVFPVFVQVANIALPDGAANVAFLSDLTKLKQAEENLNQTAKELEISLEKTKGILNQTIASLATIVEIGDPYTAGHQNKVAQLATSIAREMGLSEDKIEEIFVSATIHDIGKINIPSEILCKPGKITEFEYGIIKTHCQTGYEIIKQIEFPWPIAEIILQHHEKIDGSGYPKGLKGNEILLASRILKVADVIDAISSHRPYRPALGIDVALEEISDNKGVFYDPIVVDACLSLFQNKVLKLA